MSGMTATDTGTSYKCPYRPIHIHIVKKGKKYTTQVVNINQSYNFDKIVRAIKRDLCCSAYVFDETDGTKSIHVRGNYYREIVEWLLKERIVKVKEQIKPHNAVQS